MESPATIYVGWSGWKVTALSYTQASEMASCGKKFELKRIEGYEEATPSASFKFGIACENAVVAHLQAGVDIQKKFEAEWTFWKNVKLEYSTRDGDWEKMLGTGRNLMKEFLNAHRELFPNLDGSRCIFGKKIRYSEVHQALWNGVDIEYIADCIDPANGMLLDFKTAAASYPEPQPGEVNLIPWDNQLRIGSFLSGLRQVGFLTLIKTKTPKIQFLTGQVTQEMVEDVQVWLKSQLDRIRNKEFGRHVGWKFPNQHCDWCEVKDACFGRAEAALAAGTLVKKTSKTMDVQAEMAALDAL